MSETNKNVKPDVMEEVKSIVYVTKENVWNNVKVCKPEMPDVKET